MINIKCAKCGTELDEPGGLVFSPPLKRIKWSITSVNKIHVCYDCWLKLEKWLEKYCPK